MLRNETHLRAAQREADNYPREVHADGRSWQFWSLSAVADRRPVAWYTDGAQFMLFNVNGTVESGGHPAAHDARCRYWAPGGLRMADEKLPASGTAGRQQPQQFVAVAAPFQRRAHLLDLREHAFRGFAVVADATGLATADPAVLVQLDDDHARLAAHAAGDGERLPQFPGMRPGMQRAHGHGLSP